VAAAIVAFCFRTLYINLLTYLFTYLLIAHDNHDGPNTGANISPRARCRLAAERMPFADDVTAVDPGATWRSSIQDGGVTSQPSHVTSAANLWSLPDARRARVVNALKGRYLVELVRFGLNVVAKRHVCDDK